MQKLNTKANKYKKTVNNFCIFQIYFSTYNSSCSSMW